MKRVPDLPVTRLAALLAALALLTGCAAMFSASVTTFHQWPTDAAGQTYRLADPTDGQNGLEYAAYADLLHAAIATTGLVTAERDQPARFTVSLDYRSEAAQIIRRNPVDPFFHGVWGRPWGWGWGAYYTPAWFAVPQDAWRSRVTVIISDSAGATGETEVYRASAVSATTENPALAPAMPQLLRAIFEEFPGNNGQVREVRYRQPARQP